MSERKTSKFLRKLFGILDNELFADAITWDDQGLTIIISNQDKMENQIIPLHFSLRKFSSFVRQLHLYDFHKKKSKRHELIFCNQHFQRDQRQLATQIMRKRKTKAQKQFVSDYKQSVKTLMPDLELENLDSGTEAIEKNSQQVPNSPSLACIVLKSYSQLEDIDADPFDILNLF